MEKKILRMMATGLVGCMLAVTATGCGNSGTSSTPATTASLITMMHGRHTSMNISQIRLV